MLEDPQRKLDTLLRDLFSFVQKVFGHVAPKQPFRRGGAWAS
jgi:hypothetical protein